MQVSLTPPLPPADPQAAIHPRQAEILAAVRQAFVEKGFDGASMQDLARAAGMSVGNFYRYFPNKAAIIRDMVLMDAGEIRRDFALILQAPDPLAALRGGLRERIFGPDCSHDSALWAEIDAAARRIPEVADAHRMIQAEVRGQFIAVFAAATGLPIETATRHFSAHAAFLILLFKAAACTEPSCASHSEDLRDMIVATMDQKLAEIRSLADRSSE